MKTRSLSLSLLALATASTLVACSSDDPETPSDAASSAGASGAPSAGAPGGSSAPAATADGEAVVDPDAVLEIEDQVSEGPTVNVKTAVVTTGGWVVVASDGGRNVLGAGEVPAGAAAGELVQVSLAEIITEETELEARLYQDTNKDGFYGAGDRPVTNDDADDDDAPDVFAGELEVFSFRGADVVNQ